MHQDTKASELDAAIEEVREDLRQEFSRTFKDHAEIAHVEGGLVSLLEVRLQMLQSRLRSLSSGDQSRPNPVGLWLERHDRLNRDT